MTFSINLLGGLTVTRQGEPISLPTRKAGALLAYLACYPDRPVPRDFLAELLWPDRESAVANLRAELVRLRKAIGNDNTPLLAINRYTITLRSALAHIDTQHIQKLLDICESHEHPRSGGCQDCCALLSQASDLYHAPVLEGFSIHDSPEFEEWLSGYQEGYQNRLLVALEALQTHLVYMGKHLLVAKYARRHLALSPWQEAPLIRLLKALTLSGSRDEAIEAYNSVRSLLIKEFGVGPSLAATQVYDMIRAQRMTEGARPVESDSPYPGLAAFDRHDAPNFYGRGTVVEKLVQAVNQQSIVLLTGPSGSGKSSVAQAGLIPRLIAPGGGATDSWSIVTMRPRRNPFVNLARALALPPSPEEAAIQIAATLRRRNTTLRQIVRKAVDGSVASTARKRRILLFIDQFEEIFTLCKDEEIRRLFLTQILAKPHRPEGDESVTILIALRADFLGQALGSRSFSQITEEFVVFLGAMSDQALRRAITEPARRKGIEYEPGLIERIVNDLEDSPAQLPLLQFSLALLWGKRTAHWITHEAYDAINRVSGALTHYADGIYEHLSPGEQESARRVLLQLVHPGEGAEDTRRLASRTEIGEEHWPLVHTLANARLIVTNQIGGIETVEVIHETLIQKWPRLREWLEEDRSFRLWLNRVRGALRNWHAAAKEDDALLRGLVLAEAERWLAERRGDLEEGLVDFIGRSLQVRQWREENERRRSEELTLALAESRRQERRALARQLGAQADQIMRRKSDLALLLSHEALQLSDLPQDRTDLLTSLEINPYLQKILHDHPAAVYQLVFGADGHTLYSFDQRNNVRIWQTDSYTGSPLPTDVYGPINDVTIAPTGSWIATIHNNQVVLWEMPSLQARVLEPQCEFHIFNLLFSSDGSHLLCLGENNESSLWETRSGTKVTDIAPIPPKSALQLGPDAAFLVVGQDINGEISVHTRGRQTNEPLGPPMLGHQESLHGMALSADAARLATTSFDGTARVWDTRTNQQSGQTIREHKGRVLFATFSRDGAWLATGGTDNQVLLWDTESGERLDFPPFQHNNWVRWAAFSADRSTLASGDSDGKIYIWNLARATHLRGHQKRARTVALTPDGRILATISFDGTIGLWDAASRQHLRTLTAKVKNKLMTGRFSPDGKRLAAIDESGELYIWETQTWQKFPSGENRHHEPCITLAFSPDSRLLLQADMNGLVSLWDAETGKELRPATKLHGGLEPWILSLAFAPDGETFATGGKDGSIGFWSVSDFTPARPSIQAHTNWTTYLLFTGDGQNLISTSSDSTVRFWNAQIGQESAPPLAGHTGQVWQAEFSPIDGEKVLITLGADGGVIWWDLQDHTPLAPVLRTHTETESMAISPDGKWLYLASFDDRVYVWEILQPDWSDHCLQIANRSLTEGEWKTYLGNGD